ncbi:MAG: signal peptidase I [Spirochaetaceae bacterium]|jgi:signal peptidase I|nr:signal peptidase I [Spirochaetaceae bacterium]
MVAADGAPKDFFDRIQTVTEQFLTKRRRKKRLKREKQERKSVFVDWVESFLWAATVVLIINQYLFQAYQIPSGSMIDTLLIHDRIFVNKLVYGPELLPGLLKLPSPITPQRNDVIIFENPKYISRGTAFDIAQRIIFMLTLSAIDIDKDKNGNPREHYLIKRAVGVGGDRIFNRRGEMFIQFAGEDRRVAEREYNKQRRWTHTIRRLATDADYTAHANAVRSDMWFDAGLVLPPTEEYEVSEQAFGYQMEEYSKEFFRLSIARTIAPWDRRYRSFYYWNLGWYVPAGRILPLGDNRDNSLDGRFFGAVKKTKILGQGLFIFWPGYETTETGRRSPEARFFDLQRWSRAGKIR